MVDIIETDFPRLAAEKYKKLKPKEQKKVDEGIRRIILTKNDIKNALTAKGKTVSEPMYRALKSYQELTENLYQTLRQAVDKRSNAIITLSSLHKRFKCIFYGRSYGAS